ncbi:MAG TPA: glycosyltransferase family 39 protein [Aggregatilinea sp.]|uniref:glycosyltransferase family 39 protein n=1 Tax=Aggregatilinea sp. TaxID=2806333 RepID=UPI002C40D410|nr:glycosyltransferase family 39 protein [Aggregatilinea sp.]HML24441.1 glycosyltransferase family 39 protein [Aggregatilinea sp.]
MHSNYVPEHSIDGLLTYASVRQEARLKPERILLIALLLLTFALRVTHINYNTLFVDEAIYATLGHEVLHSNFAQNAPAWMFGSYIYPYIVGVADELGGVVAIRLLSALLSLVAVIFVYLTARSLFGELPGLAAVLLFGLTGPSISLGQQAVIDALSMPLMAVSLYLIVTAALTPEREAQYLAAAGVAFTLSFLAKYISVLLLPALLGMWVVLHLFDGRSLWKIFLSFKWIWFMLPLALIVGIYGVVYQDELREVFKAENATQIATRLDVLTTVVQEIGIVVVLALIGLGLVIREAYLAMKPAGLVSRFALIRFRVQFVVIALGMVGALFGMQIYHLTTANIRSLWKHDVFTLVFLAPLAGYAVVRAIRYAQTVTGPGARERRLFIAAVLFTTSILFVNNAQNMNWSYQYSWPDATKTVRFLKTLDLNRNSYVMAAGSTVYEYYLDLRGEGRTLWFSMWFMEYQGTFGEEAIRGAIGNCALEVVILDDYYSPEWNPVLLPLLDEAGYDMVFSDLQVLSFGDPIGTRVFLPGDRGACGSRSG